MANLSANPAPVASGILTTLKGQLLVATAELNGSVFERAVIYMISHDPQGAMGIIINKPISKISFNDIVKSMNMEEMMQAGIGIGLTRQPAILKGGPVDNNRGFVLHSRDYHIASTINVDANIGLSATAEIVTDIARGQGPRHLNFCLGYAGWAAGQLEDELHGTGWLVAPPHQSVIFDLPPAERYQAATRCLGLDALNFSDDIIGQA